MCQRQRSSDAIALVSVRLVTLKPTQPDSSGGRDRPATFARHWIISAPLARTPHGPAARDVRCHSRDVWPSRLRDVGRQLSISWRRGGIRPKAQVCPSPLRSPALDGTPRHRCRSWLALGASAPAVVQTLAHRRRREAENDAAAAPARRSESTIHGQRVASTAMPMIGPSCGGSADGVAAIHRDGEVMRAAYRSLRAKYTNTTGSAGAG